MSELRDSDLPEGVSPEEFEAAVSSWDQAVTGDQEDQAGEIQNSTASGEDEGSEFVEEENSELSEKKEEFEQEEGEDEGQPEETTEESVAQVQPELHTLEIDGRTFSVPLEDLKRGYTAQIQSLVKSQNTPANTAGDDIAQRQAISDLYQKLQSGDFLLPPKPPPPAEFKDDPYAYQEARMVYDEEKGKFDAQQAEMKRVADHLESELRGYEQARLTQEIERLSAVIPEFKDPAKIPELQGKLTKTAAFYGFSSDEFGGVTDHRAIKLLYDAMKYRNLVDSSTKKKIPAKTTKSSVAKEIKPRRSNRQAMLDKYYESGDPDLALEIYSSSGDS